MAAGQCVHMVWFKWRADAAAGAVDAAITALRALGGGAIPGVVSLSAGANFTSRAPGFTHGLLVVLENKEALPAYSDHPLHQAVVKEHILPLKEDILALDYIA